MQLLYFADAMCSWCWGFAPVIETLKRENPELPVTVIMGGLRPQETRAMNAEIRESLHRHWRKIDGMTGQPFVFEQHPKDGFVYNTEAASRAVVTMRHLNPHQQLPYLHRLQQAFYAEQQDITDPEILIRLARECGAPPDFPGSFHSVAMQAATARDFERRWDSQVLGFPSLILESAGREQPVTMGYCPIAQGQQQLASALKRILE